MVLKGASLVLILIIGFKLTVISSFCESRCLYRHSTGERYTKCTIM